MGWAHTAARDVLTLCLGTPWSPLLSTASCPPNSLPPQLLFCGLGNSEGTRRRQTLKTLKSVCPFPDTSQSQRAMAGRGLPLCCQVRCLGFPTGPFLAAERPFSRSSGFLVQRKGVSENMTGSKYVRMQHLQGKRYYGLQICKGKFMEQCHMSSAVKVIDAEAQENS